MATNSGIEWTHHTCNLWQGCTRVHAGCDHCYAAALSKRWGNQLWDKLEDGTPAPRMHVKAGWGSLAKWQRTAAEAEEYHRVFVGSMMDIFEKPMPLVDSKGAQMRPFRSVNYKGEHNYGLEVGPVRSNTTTVLRSVSKEDRPLTTSDSRDMFFREIVRYPNLMFLLLTKRPSNINKLIPKSWLTEPPRNVMFGASVVDNASLRNVMRHLGKVNGATFLSIEPLLEDLVDWPEVFDNHELTNIPEWVIVGGESGHHARSFNPDWARRIQRYCSREVNTAFFMKQMGGKRKPFEPIPDDLMVREFPDWHNFKPQYA